MFRQLLAFEWAFHTKQVSFYLALSIALVVGSLMGTGLYPGPHVYINSPANIGFVSAFFSLAAVFVLMITCANAMLRDSSSKMTELVFATPLTQWQMLSSRFCGAFLAAVFVMTCALFGAMLGVNLPWVDPDAVGPINGLYYLWALLIVVLPSMLFSGALIFAVAALTRSTIATYLSAAIIYIGYMIIAGIGGSPMFVGNTPPSPEMFALAAKFDPFALSTYYQQTQFWTPEEKNSRLLILESHFLFNRLFLMTLGCGLFAALHFSYKMQLPKQKAAKSTKAVTTKAKVPYRVMPVATDKAALRSAWWSTLKLEVSLVIKSWPFIAMLVMYSVLVLMESRNMTIGMDFGPNRLPTTSTMLGGFMFDVLPRFGAIFMIYYSAEVYWRDHNAGFKAFIDCSPVNSLVLFGSKLLALLSVPFFMIISSIVMSLILQIASGYTAFEPMLYLSVFYYAGLPLLYIAVLALFMQTVSKNRYVGMLLTTTVLLITGTGIARWLGLEHPMWRFAQAPVLDYTDMNGYGIGGDGFFVYMLYWGAFAVLLSVLAYALWPRGAEQTLKYRAQRLITAKSPAFGAVAVMLAAGSVIFYQTNITNEYLSSDASVQRRADYEKAYKQYQYLPKPQVTGMKVNAELYPRKRRYFMRNQVELTNLTDKPIEQLFLSAVWGSIQTQVFTDVAKSIRYDERFDTYLIDLKAPLQPNQSMDMTIELSDKQSGFVSTSFRNTVIENGSYITLNSIMPYFGYRPGREIQQKRQRLEYQLPPKRSAETLAEAIDRKQGDFRDEFDWLDYEITVSTDRSQTVITQGELTGQWHEKGRKFFHYKSNGKIRYVLALHSGRFDSRKVNHNGVSVEVYFHPGHDYNLAHMIDSVKQSLDYFSQHFSPYPHNHLRITEVLVGQNSRATGFATAGNMLITNYGGFLSDMNSPYDVDQVYRRIAHEVAHQWWGYQLSPALVPGSLMLVETLAKYAEMRILERKFGKQHVQELVAYESRRYLRGRVNQLKPELPLYAAQGDQNHLFYAKGGYAMYHLTELLGEQVMNQALRQLLQTHAYPFDLPLSTDFIDILTQVAPSAASKKIDELLKQVVLYDFKITNANYKPLSDGLYQVSLELDNKKYQVNERREQIEIALSEDVEIAFYDDYPSEQTLITIVQPRLSRDGQKLQFIVEKEAKYLQVDPKLMFIDVNRQNNLQQLSLEKEP